MAHSISVALPAQTVKNKDVEFEVRKDGEILGRVKISKGGIDWYAKNAKQRTGRATWTQFKTYMES